VIGRGCGCGFDHRRRRRRKRQLTDDGREEEDSIGSVLKETYDTSRCERD